MNIHSIKFKLTVGLLISMLTGTVGIIYVYNLAFARNVNKMAEEAIAGSQQTFANLIDNDSRALSSALLSLLDNKEIASLFLTGDKNRLYRRTAPLFQNLEENCNITHWYFIYPENISSEKSGTCFLRVHDTTLSGDKIRRFTFLKAVEKKSVVSGIELGKTAFALRVVAPYYSDKKLIGYMEVGEEICHLLYQMKSQTKAEIGLLVDKKYLNREDWNTVRVLKGFSDSWDQMANVVLVSSTTRDECLIEYNGTLTSVPDKGILLEHIRKDNRHFARGLFPFYDAGNRKVGGIFVLLDITPQYVSLQKTRVHTIGLSILITILITVVILFMMQGLVIKRLRIMTDKAVRVAGGDYHARIEKSKNDEIGEFETLFEQFRVLFVALLEKLDAKQEKQP